MTVVLSPKTRKLVVVFFIFALGSIALYIGLSTRRKNVEYFVLPRLVTTTASSNVIDPAKLYTLSQYYIIHNVTRQLITLGRDGEYQRSSLLSDFAVLNENRGIRGVLSPDAKYSDGTPILARDVLKSFQRLILTGSAHTTPKEMIHCASAISSMEEKCSGLIEVDERTFEIHFTSPVKEIVYYLQLADYSILHPKQYMKTEPLTLEDWNITSGYYSLIQIPSSNDLMLQANPFHYQKGQIPKILLKSVLNDQDFIKGIRKNEFHLGGIGFKHYRMLREQRETFDNYELIADRHAWVVGLVLNTHSTLFNDAAARRWLYKRVFAHLEAPKEYPEISEKALQFFLPLAPGRLSEEDIREEIAKFGNTDEPPESLRNGFRIRAAQNLGNLFPIELVEEIKRILAPVKVEYVDDVEHKDYVRFKKERDFDAAMMVTSMSYKEPSESLNLAFTSDAPTLTDPTGRIHRLLAEEHSTLDDAKGLELTKQALRQMVSDAEFVPLLYVGTFSFVDKELLDSSNVHFWESTQFHTFRLK